MNQLAESPRRAWKIFYGWWIVAIAFFSSFVVAGTGGYIFGQFIAPLSQAFGWSVGLVSSATLARSLTGMFTAPIIGRVTDRIGSRPIMLLGALIGGGAFLSLAFITQPILFYFVFTVITSLGYSMLGGIPAQSSVTRWFRRRRGMAMAVVSMGISTGGVVMVPLVQMILASVGWRFAFGAIGVGIWLVMLPLVFFLMRDDPTQLGLSPDGEVIALNAANETSATASDERVWTAQQVIASGNFWKQALGYMFGSAMLQMMLVHQFPFITQLGFDGATAAWIVSFYALCAGVSKFGWGYMADRFDVRYVAFGGIWLACIGIVILLFATSLPLVIMYALVGGAGIGGLAALQGMVTAQTFGRRSYGTVAGMLNPMNNIASAIAVPFAGYMFDLTGSYTLPFAMVVALVIATSTSLLTLKK